ncbi:hemerythrin family protein [Sulfuricurvum sp.]|uniref:bacteriohemerythrin n=1 Tax=Sulfuricurvum sp. TaxID=2025608 RepID=UPI002610F559|nr:hemerythrin family protein [Sulfuricurvum sp.]MDD4884983.1 hemerythrin family protein [Sulfuricurvum sp.]
MTHFPESLKVGIESIDRRHEEFWELFENLKSASDDTFSAAFEGLIAHTKEHFAEEESDMSHLDYPNHKEHVAEHQKALDEMGYFLQKAQSGRLMFAKAYARDRLGDWFRNHLLNMDSDLARVIVLSAR